MDWKTMLAYISGSQGGRVSTTSKSWWCFVRDDEAELRELGVDTGCAPASNLIRSTLFALKFAFEIAPQHSINNFVRGQRKSNVL